MLTERRLHYVRHQAAKLLSARSLGKVVRNPGIIAKHIQGFFFDKNLTNPFKDVERDAVVALVRLVAPLENPKTTFNEWLPTAQPGKDTEDLAELLTKHGSDKATHHDYHLFYGAILAPKRNVPINILEIGLGTNNIDVPSNMGLWGKPGASLRAFRDWAPLARVFGADVDKRVLFEEDRISTSWVDQTDIGSLGLLASALKGKKFDLIIDDGLHLPHANFNSMSALLPLLAPDGIFVVEDIEAGHRDYWHLTRSLLHPKYDCCLTDAKGGSLFFVRHATD
jgi:hypothetical protein